MRELANKVSIVTGASQGIGRVISLRLAKAGAQLVLTGRNTSGLEETAKLIRDSGAAIEPHVCKMDLLDPDSVEACISEVLDKFGRIDVLVNNSGITGNPVAVWEQSENDWDKTIDTNLKGPFLVTKAVIPSMIKRRTGTIVFIGSVTGKRPFINRGVYAASKLGLVGLVRTLAVELGPHGIRANLISPGFVEGPRLDGVFADVARTDDSTLDEAREKMLGMIPAGKFVQPENIAEGVLFLASDRSIGITGEDLNVSGGLVMY